MTVLSLKRKELEKIIGKINQDIENKISMFGTPIENLTEEEISVEVYPNRPDLLSMQGFSRAISMFIGKGKIKKYHVKKSKDYKIIIDKSVKEVRPYTACAVIRKINFDDEKIKEVIDIQERLHGSYGRDRRRLAIGIYPLEKIKFPIKFLAKKPEEIRFQPLDFPRELNGKEILLQHPTGREYAYLLKDLKTFPIFEDSEGKILSMPPIINSETTGKIIESTKDVFIECSGFNRDYLQKTLNIIVCAIADMGGEIYSTEIIDKEKFFSPNLEYEKMVFSIENINKLIGLNLKEKDIIKLLRKMGIGYEKNKNKSIALIPPYRTDILHEVDIGEEIAIAYGYEKLIPEIPNISTIGEENKISILKRKISEILIGLGLIEVSSYHLSTKEKQFKNLCIKEYKDDLIEIINSKTENNILRTSLLAQNIQVLSENLDSSYPQKIFEIGKVFKNNNSCETKIEEIERLAISLCHEKANFTEIKQTIDYLMRMLNINYEIRESEHPSFISGRCGEIIVNNKPIGFIGEISPYVLSNNKIKMPVASLEISIENLII